VRRLHRRDTGRAHDDGRSPVASGCRPAGRSQNRCPSAATAVPVEAQGEHRRQPGGVRAEGASDRVADLGPAALSTASVVLREEARWRDGGSMVPQPRRRTPQSRSLSQWLREPDARRGPIDARTISVTPMGDRLRLSGPGRAAPPPVVQDQVASSPEVGRFTRRRLLQVGAVFSACAALPQASRPRSTLQGLGYSALGMKALGS
jgi:hypothetical protein